ncbi:DUF1289 domain-containing protein [Novosphingobium sp. APW14]|uniref:DUF1289 domain-containing protein n=1 Tax=Novosphingobium sp. APW14 TaxID=3077237 RepID=UPI0028DD9A05|nr:DUF1289 domain-containing protein [Novosphingobium sp. APW14]MDT9013506.1 DUF1289 domain-containing protein [Novosphingobium sp. APW14]
MASGQAGGAADDPTFARAGGQALGPRTVHGPESPCDGTCQIDRATGWCRGCKRRVDEIADWPMLSVRGKQAILRGLKDRR